MPVTFDVLRNDTDPDEGDTLTVRTITTQGEGESRARGGWTPARRC